MKYALQQQNCDIPHLNSCNLISLAKEVTGVTLKYQIVNYFITYEEADFGD